MKLSELIVTVFNVSEAEISESTRLMSFDEWDSMTHMIFITQLEEVYQINLNGDEIASMETVGDVRRILLTKDKVI